MSNVHNIKKFGLWYSRSNEPTVYQAKTDGIVIARAAPGVTAAGVSDLNATPTTNRATNISDGSTTGSITFPVRKGDYWMVSGCTSYVFWIGFI